MGIQIKRIGHVGILVSDFERSFKFYTEVLGCKVTSRRKRPDGSETAFLRFEDTHHDFVIASAPEDVDVSSAVGQRERLVQQIAFEVENRDEFMKALAHLHTKGVKIINGPLTHGIESGGNLEGSGSRSFYFNDPDGNRLEIFTDGMKVPNGEEFPRKEYAEALKDFMKSRQPTVSQAS
jgi:catechol 2,3-dioxygenase-like lactoylglutathione lyase family enzyme